MNVRLVSPTQRDLLPAGHVYAHAQAEFGGPQGRIRNIDPVCRSVEVDESTLAVDAIGEVGPDGNFFGAAHTLERYETAFYKPFLSDLRNFEAWEEAGSMQTAERANKIWKQILDEFEPPTMDEAIREELEAFVERRKEEGGAPTDF